MYFAFINLLISKYLNFNYCITLHLLKLFYFEFFLKKILSIIIIFKLLNL